MKPALVVLLLDAFRWDYLSQEVTPFLYQTAGEALHVVRVRPGFGYCERAAILTGLTAAESGFFTAIGYDPPNSPYRRHRSLLQSLSWERSLPGVPRKVMRRAVEELLLKDGIGLRSYFIPTDLLGDFALTEDAFDHSEPGALPPGNLLERVRAAGGRVSLAPFTTLRARDPLGDEDRLRLATRVIQDGADLVFVYIGAPDQLGHRHGPDPGAFAHELKSLDAALQQFVRVVGGARPWSRFVFLGDHGMTRVARLVDCGHRVRSIARKRNLRWRDDYWFFLDSTLCRIWCRNTDVSSLLGRELQDDDTLCSNGVILTEEMAARYSVPWGDRRYGDMVWAAHPGVLVEPDYFRAPGSPPAGMHGYMTEAAESHGTCIVTGEGVERQQIGEMDLTGTCELLWSQFRQLRQA